jgi:NAD(P)H-hydrate epimerase
VNANELISIEQMRAIDARSQALGVPTRVLMENAGAAVAAAIAGRFGPRDTIVLAGPGMNGGDGFVAARKLAERGFPVRIAMPGKRAELRGDAADAASGWMGFVEEQGDGACLRPGDLVVDALFGAGLSRPLAGGGADMALRAGQMGLDVVAIDLPSGVPGDGTAPSGVTFRAMMTVTFVRKKPGHACAPGRLACGEIVLASIGEPAQAVREQSIAMWENGPQLWRIPTPAWDAHKYARGHVVAVSGPAGRTGAIRLAARAALRAGAGVVSVLAPAPAMAEHAARLDAIMLALLPTEASSLYSLAKLAGATLIGPAAGVTKQTKEYALALLAAQPSCVLDADALSVFSDQPSLMFEAVSPHCVLTPHPGEFTRLFPDLAGLPRRIDQAREAAIRAGCVVLLKGPDTMIAAPDGRVRINTTGTPYLATAGAGDVLAGLICGLMAQGMSGFDAASAGAWIHGRAGERLGPGLIADDLPEALPGVMRDLV